MNRLMDKRELISIIIPVYNVKPYLTRCFETITLQSYQNLEIILVDDGSKDGSGDLCDFLSKSDETILDVVYREAVNGSYDIVEFKAVEHNNYIVDTSKKMKDSEYSNHKNNLVLYQPELGRYPRIRNNKYGVYDCFLWAKCIKSNVYKKTLNKIGEKSYSLRIIWGEDLVTSFALFRTASSFKFIGKYGIFRYKSKKTASNNTPYKLYALSIVLYMDVVYDFTSNSIEDKKYAVDVAIGYFKNIRMIRELNYLNTILAKYLKSNFINEVDKNRIRNIFSKYNKLGIVVN